MANGIAFLKEIHYETSSGISNSRLGSSVADDDMAEQNPFFNRGSGPIGPVGICRLLKSSASDMRMANRGRSLAWQKHRGAL